MAIPKFESDLNIISRIGDYPLSDSGLETEDFKKRFDLAGILIQQYLNNVLIPNLNNIVDVESLLRSILDETMGSQDKAAQAKAVGLRLHDRRMDVGKILEKAYLGGDFAIPGTDNFHAYLSGEDTIRIRGGSCIMQGNLIELPTGYVKSLKFQSGLGGTYRSDLVCLRVSRDEDGKDEKSIILIEGVANASIYSDPEHMTGDINSGVAVRDFPLYRLKANGASVSLEPLFFVEQKKTITLSASGWSGESAPFTQTATVSGMADRRRVMVYPAYGDDAAENIAMKESCASVSYASIEGGIATFVCLEDKPDVDIRIVAEVFV